MRGLLKGTLVVGLALTMAGVAQAQRPGGRGFSGPGFLLRSPEVREELKLTDDQTTKLKDALDKVRDAHKDDFGKLRELSREDRQKLLRTVGAESRKAIAGVLDAKQMKRFKQLLWQAGGPNALNDPEVQKTLKLSDEQKTKLKDVFDDSNKKTRELFQGGNREGAREKVQEIRKEAREKANGVLSDGQKKSWKEMQGEPFAFPRRRPNN